MRKNFGVKTYLYPQPVMIIATYGEDGKPNAMNAAWGGIVGSNEIIFDLGSHKTTDNILKSKAFTVAIGDADHVVECDYVGVVSANKAPDKMEKSGFTATKSEFVNAPIINELPLCLECELIKVIDGNKFLGEIKNVSADEKILDAEGKSTFQNLLRSHMIRPITAITDSAKRSATLSLTERSSSDFGYMVL